MDLMDEMVLMDGMRGPQGPAVAKAMADKDGSSGGGGIRRPALQRIALRGEGVEALELEVRGGGEQVTVVGIDGLEAVDSRGGQVQGVGSPQINRAGQAGIDGADPVQHLGAGRKPMESAGLPVGLKLVEQGLIRLRCDGSFPQLAVKGCQDLRLTVNRASCMVRGHEFPHGHEARIFVIQTHQVTGIEVDHRSSRSMEIPVVESAPPESFAALKAGSSLRRAK